MNLLITPPFDSPIAPNVLHPKHLAHLLECYGIHVVTDPTRADFELVGCVLTASPNRFRLPKRQQVLIDGEPPQPSYLLPHYLDQEYALVLTPANLMAYADDFAFYRPPSDQTTVIGQRKRKIVQLATFRSGETYSHVSVKLNGTRYVHRLLCGLRSQIGVVLRTERPDLIDIYGMDWPGQLAMANTRLNPNFLEERDSICGTYWWDLCFENTQIPHYVTEKFWSPVRMGVLPIYWGPEDFVARLPPCSIIDARSYVQAGVFQTRELVYDLEGMTEHEYLGRVASLCEWHDSQPPRSATYSAEHAARLLATMLNTLR